MTTMVERHPGKRILPGVEELKEAKEVVVLVNMGVEPRTLALLAPRSKPTELIDRNYYVIDGSGELS